MKSTGCSCVLLLLLEFGASALFAQTQLCFPDDKYFSATPHSSAPGVCVSEKDEAARLVQWVDPIYPPILHGRMPAGTVILHAEIGGDGRVVALNYVSGPALLMRSATDAVAKWRYRPLLVKGRAAVVYTTIAVHFASLANPSASRQGVAARVQVAGSEEAKALVHQVLPIYPAAAEERGVTGTIVFHAIIGTDGAVKQLDYISGPKILVESASDAVRMWRYKPLLKNGQPVEVETAIPVVYMLNP